MSAETKDDKFERLWKHADEMFAKVDKMFANFPWSEPLQNDGFFHRTVTYTNPVMEEFEPEPANDPSEYKLVKPPSGGFDGKKDIEAWLNGYGAEGWDLNCFEFGYAIFSRFVEEDDETEESGPEDV